MPILFEQYYYSLKINSKEIANISIYTPRAPQPLPLGAFSMQELPPLDFPPRPLDFPPLPLNVPLPLFDRIVVPAEYNVRLGCKNSKNDAVSRFLSCMQLSNTLRSGT